MSRHVCSRQRALGEKSPLDRGLPHLGFGSAGGPLGLSHAACCPAPLDCIPHRLMLSHGIKGALGNGQRSPKVSLPSLPNGRMPRSFSFWSFLKWTSWLLAPFPSTHPASCTILKMLSKKSTTYDNMLGVIRTACSQKSL